MYTRALGTSVTAVPFLIAGLVEILRRPGHDDGSLLAVEGVGPPVPLVLHGRLTSRSPMQRFKNDSDSR